MQVMKINIPRGFPTGGTLKSEVSKPDIGHKNVKSIVPTGYYITCMIGH